MAGILFIGFDLSKEAAGLGAILASTSSTQWSHWIRPRGVYHNKGAATKDSVFFPPNSAAATSSGCIFSGNGAGSALGNSSNTFPYSGSSPTTRSVWASAQGHQLAVNRSEAGIDGEIWVTFDVRVGTMSSGSLGTGFSPASSWAKIFVWGDVEVSFKSSAWTGSDYTYVFTVRNNGLEIATVTVPLISSPSAWLFMKIHVKLDATTGLIEVSCNGNEQSTPYTAQNTVTTTPLATAGSVFVGPPVADDGTTAYVGNIDHIYFDGAAFPAGRPLVLQINPSSDATLTNFAAVGASPTTVVQALSIPLDAKAARATASGGSAVVNISAISVSQYLTDILGVVIGSQKATNRNSSFQRRLQTGYSLSGVETMANTMRNTPLPFSSQLNPPENVASSSSAEDQIFLTSASTVLTATELSTMKIVIKSVAP